MTINVINIKLFWFSDIGKADDVPIHGNDLPISENQNKSPIYWKMIYRHRLFDVPILEK